MQVGSYRSAADAMAGWRQVSTSMDLAAFRPLTATIMLPGRGLFHRLSVGGFESRAEAERTCDEIKAMGGACFVRTRAGDEPLPRT